jgi:hypothetical protein
MGALHNRRRDELQMRSWRCPIVLPAATTSPDLDRDKVIEFTDPNSEGAKALDNEYWVKKDWC